MVAMTWMISFLLCSILLVDFAVSKRLDLTIESSGDFDFSGDVTDQNPHFRVSDYVSGSSQSAVIDIPPDFSGDVIVTIGNDGTTVEEASGSGEPMEEMSGSGESIDNGSGGSSQLYKRHKRSDNSEDFSGESSGYGSGASLTPQDSGYQLLTDSSLDYFDEIIESGEEVIEGSAVPYKRMRIAHSGLHRDVGTNATSDANSSSSSNFTSPSFNTNSSSSNNTCASQVICFADSDCGDKGRCVGLFAGTCNCKACVNHKSCLDDSFCGGLVGACNNATQRCNCRNGFTAAGFSSLASARVSLCNKKSCDRSMSQCFGLPCHMGRCFC